MFIKPIRKFIGCVIVLIGIYYILLPSLLITGFIYESSSNPSKIPLIAKLNHARITQGFGEWAERRVEQASGTDLSLNDISGTEWPMFSAVFYLWATEELDRHWQNNPNAVDERPTVYAQNAIETAIKLILDPANATWVKTHWGDDYLYTENVFYRMLLIAGLTSYQELTGKRLYQSLLSRQVLSLAEELDKSKFGVLDDYPGECYPIDILPAVAIMKRADSMLNLGLRAKLNRMKRGFTGNFLDPNTGLPAYVADKDLGIGIGPSRGVAISYMLIWMSELWPDTFDDWERKYEMHFVEQGRWLAGIREFPKRLDVNYSFGDVDSGPIIAGYGIAASAFGLGAARTSGDNGLIYQLQTQAILASWPLAHGRLHIPKLLSDLSDAPYLGETALLFVLTRTAQPGDQQADELHTPLIVIVILVLSLFFSFVFIRLGVRIFVK